MFCGSETAETKKQDAPATPGPKMSQARDGKDPSIGRNTILHRPYFCRFCAHFEAFGSFALVFRSFWLTLTASACTFRVEISLFRPMDPSVQGWENVSQPWHYQTRSFCSVF